MADIAWDIEKLQDIKSQIVSCKEMLQRQREQITKLQGNAADNWQSDAGRAYSERISEDVASIDQVLKDFSDLEGKLEKAVQIYARGELDVHRKMWEAINNLSVR